MIDRPTFARRWLRRLAIVGAVVLCLLGLHWWFGPIRPLIFSASDIHEHYEDRSFTGDFVRYITARCTPDAFHSYARQQGLQPVVGDALPRECPIWGRCIQDNPTELGELWIYNDYLRGDDVFSSFSAMVVFRALPKKGVTQIKSGERASVPVEESYDSKIGPNSSSQVAVSLSADHDIFLVVYEQGTDSTRSTTWKKLPIIVRELKRLASLPEEYLVVEKYSALFALLFSDTKPDHRIQRLPGMQDRDTFYGFLKPTAQWNLEGINIKISHPVYCDGECTRESSRTRKAEFLGVPSDRERDRLFFLIEDNAVYLKHPYDADFGTFSGSKSFEGTLEIIDGGGKPIVTSKEQFKGWER